MPVRSFVAVFAKDCYDLFIYNPDLKFANFFLPVSSKICSRLFDLMRPDASGVAGGTVFGYGVSRYSKKFQTVVYFVHRYGNKKNRLKKRFLNGRGWRIWTADLTVPNQANRLGYRSLHGYAFSGIRERGGKKNHDQHGARKSVKDKIIFPELEKSRKLRTIFEGSKIR